MERLGERGNISISTERCNKDIGLTGLEELPPYHESSKQYVDLTGRHRVDFQLNIPKFGQEIHNGILNTKEMAKKWNWKSDSDELNWRNKPCALRIGYNEEDKTFKVQIWNDLLQIWIYLSLTKEDIEKILSLETRSYKTDNLYCDKVKSKDTEHGVEWSYYKNGKVIDTAFMTYKELYEILAGKAQKKCQFCDSTDTERYQPRDEDTAINLCEQHEKYIQRISQRIHGVVEET